MELYILIPLLCCIIVIIVLSIKLKKKQEILEKTIIQKHEIEVARTNELKDYFKEEWRREENELDKNIRSKRESINLESIKLDSNFQIKETKLASELHLLEETLKEKEKRYNEVNQDLDLYRSGKINEINQTAAEYEQRRQIEIKNELEEYYKNWLTKYDEEISKIADLRTQKLEELEKVKNELEEERSKRAAINEELRKAEEKEKYNEIHSVQLTNNEKEDIHFLLSLEDKMHNKQVLYKLVWSTYLHQAYKNTFHNILGSRDPKNVIYCIENINTGKKYIGKTSAEVSKRWTEHIKTSLNIGTIKTTNIHKALYNHWDEFIFYIIAETEKDKLSEMEKYYIKFYESDKYGYNIKAGG